MLHEKIIKDTLAEIPVGYIPAHNSANLSELVKYHVKRSCLLGAFSDEAEGLQFSSNLDDYLDFVKRISEITD